ncbi:pyrrolo-quinoline quinone, partial [bacterium]|nr:pyrrolo-quinoline quinone [bacterium]
IVDGKVYIGNENGTMLVFAAAKEKKLISTIEMKGKIRATPVAVNSTIFIITENPCRLYSITKN